MSGWELDHVFVCCKPGGPEAAVLERLGLIVSEEHRHPGQGTVGRVVAFDNAYLELLWAVDEAELASPPVSGTRLLERFDWRSSGASPFGLSWRPAAKGAEAPFATWDYEAPYLPSGASIPVAVSSSRLDEPLLFLSLVSAPPASWPESGRPPLQSAKGWKQLGRPRVAVPGPEPSTCLGAALATGLCEALNEDGPILELDIDGATGGRVSDLRPDLPIRLRW